MNAFQDENVTSNTFLYHNVFVSNVDRHAMLCSFPVKDMYNVREILKYFWKDFSSSLKLMTIKQFSTTA